jgi:hypothetical protein
MLVKKAPNLTLNIKRTIPENWMAWLFMYIGVSVQCAVITINAMVVYYWRWLRAGHIVAPYGFPLWVIGTSSMTLGVSLCAEVIRMSTILYTLGPPSSLVRDNRAAIRIQSVSHQAPFRIFKVQEQLETANLPGYLILHDRKNLFIDVSKRVEDGSSGYHLLLVYLGIFLSLTGFICQNIGTRELHWSAGVLQLGATLSLVLIRAFLRRHVGKEPSPKPICLSEVLKAEQIASGLEESNFALLCDYIRDWPEYEASQHLNASILYQKSKNHPYEAGGVYEPGFWPDSFFSGKMSSVVSSGPLLEKTRNMIEARHVL